ncbi:hypothetical protein QTP86_027097 [Hemibagrus guttatus]|nr:hypothetical protein QTP86_027097 [Hemibagrus guttatus]
MHVFGPGEETGVPGGNPRGTGRTCKLHTHSGGGNRNPNPGGRKHYISVSKCKKSYSRYMTFVQELSRDAKHQFTVTPEPVVGIADRSGAVTRIPTIYQRMNNSLTSC